MNTDELILALAHDIEAEPAVTDGLWLRLGLGVAVCVALVGLTLGYRQDLGPSLLVPVSALRFVLTLALFAVAMQMTLLLARPEGALRLRYWPILTIGALALLAFGWTLANTPQAEWATAIRGTTLVWCLSSIPILSCVPVALLMLALRRGAPSRPRLLGAVAGLAGSSVAAATYALHCIEDSPLFYVTWYGVAILFVTGVSALIAERLLRW